eukprot:TRINITY_DN7548_c0_g1_i3.p1 TRINITY_DN7548_c0_g1~~TRINITY_DN7548_c0_g1_i3.p1  ORF type:complete len:153 (-),score=33.46 TRINITY_DN7548_c0_g1_i3:136-594(-)
MAIATPALVEVEDLLSTAASSVIHSPCFSPDEVPKGGAELVSADLGPALLPCLQAVRVPSPDKIVPDEDLTIAASLEPDSDGWQAADEDEKEDEDEAVGGPATSILEQLKLEPPRTGRGQRRRHLQREHAPCHRRPRNWHSAVRGPSRGAHP